MRIDHVVYGTADLELATARIEKDLGLPVLPGGHHEGQGTHNRIVPLGNAYLELMAIDDADEAAASPIGKLLLECLAVERLVAWVVTVEDIGATAERLGTPIHTVRREGLSGNLTGVEAALTEPTLPFFIQANARPGSGGTQELTYVEVAGDKAKLEHWLDGAELPVRVVDGEPAVRAVGVGTGEFRPG